MRKASVIPAAALAAGFIFGLASPVMGKTAKSSKSHVKSASAVSGRVHGNAKKASSKRKAQHVVHQNAGGDVVLDRVSVEAAEIYGPFPPVEMVDYPRPRCEAIDAVLEAVVHEADDEAPENEEAADDIPGAAVSTLARAARSFGSFLKPKSSQSTMRPEEVDLGELVSAGIQIPVEGVDASGLRDSFLNSRGRHRQHLAIDIGAPKGTPVIAAADGEIVRMSREKRGGIALYQKDPSGKYLLFYCHLSRYQKGIKVGDRVSKGDVIAYVGRTGHASGPHLHFSITRLPEDDDNFKAGVAINPYLLFLAAVQ